MLLPPDAVLDLFVPHGEQVVSVHADVHERVAERNGHGVASANELGQDPNEDHHHAVVVHVQEGDLLVLLAKHEEDLRG